MPPQLKVLIPLFAIFIAIFLVVRSFLLPDSFGVQGHYRFNSVQDNKEQSMQYAGKEACAECHDDRAEETQSDMHANISCETCHGPGLEHYENPESLNIKIPTEREHCGLCHSLNLTRSNKISQIKLSEHNVEYKCIECHNPHMPWELKELNNPEENF